MKRLGLEFGVVYGFGLGVWLEVEVKEANR